MAERIGTGLQHLLRWFESDHGVNFIESVMDQTALNTAHVITAVAYTVSEAKIGAIGFGWRNDGAGKFPIIII